MKLHFSKSLPAALALCLLSSCAQQFPASQRNAVSSVAIARTEVAADAYKTPDASEAGGQLGNTMGGGTGGGLGYLLGSAIEAGVASAQNSSFHGSNADVVAVINANKPKNLPRLLDESLERSMKRESFFGPRLRAQGSHTWHPEITSYGIRRTGKNDRGEIVFAPTVTTMIVLKDATGKRIIGGPSTGTSATSRTCREFAGNPRLLDAAYADAIRVSMETFDKNLAKVMATR